MDEARVRFPASALFFVFGYRSLYSGIITDCGSVDPGSIPGLRKDEKSDSARGRGIDTPILLTIFLSKRGISSNGRALA